MRNPFKGSDYPYGSRKRITPEGEPLEDSGVSRSLVKIVVPIIIGIIWGIAFGGQEEEQEVKESLHL